MHAYRLDKLTSIKCHLEGNTYIEPSGMPEVDFFSQSHETRHLKGVRKTFGTFCSYGTYVSSVSIAGLDIGNLIRYILRLQHAAEM